jgi:TPR repeat protein
MKHLNRSLVCLPLLLCFGAAAQTPSTPPTATNRPPLRIIVLPFANRTCQTNWDDWQQALPTFIKGFLGEAEATSVVGRKKIRDSLKQAGWENSRELNPELARQVALDSHAQVAIWGDFQRREDCWWVTAWMLTTNASVSPVLIEASGSDWSHLSEMLANSVAGRLGRRLASSDLEHVRNHQPASPTALALLARAINLEAQAAPAAEQEKVLRQLLATDPRATPGHVMLIQILGETTRTNELNQAIVEFVSQCPDVCNAHLHNASLFAQQRDEAKVKQALQAALRAHRGCPSACQALFVFVGGVLQRWEDLREILEPALAERPDRIENVIFLAATRAQCGDPKGARELLARVTELPEEDETVDLALLAASLGAYDFDLAGRELARLGPQAATNEIICGTLDSITLGPRGVAAIGSVARPKIFTVAEIEAELDHRLSAVERKLVVNPVGITPEIEAKARTLTTGLNTDAAKAIAIFAEVARRGRGTGDAGIRTASETLEQTTSPEARFSCQEYAKLFVALARAAGLESWLVHIDRDADGRPGYHDCAVVYVDGNGMLVDPTWRVFGIKHLEFEVLDDLQAISHQAMQPQDHPDPIRLHLGLKLNPADRWTRLQFIRGMARAGDFTAAAAELRRVQSLGVETWDVHDAAGVLEISRDQWRPALAELQQAVALSPSNAVVHQRLALVYSHLGDMRKYTAHMQMALDLDRGEISQAARRESQLGLQLMNAFSQARSKAPGSREALQSQATAGDLAAQMALAKALFEEQPPRFEEGMRWLRQAAGQGNDQAQFNYACNLLSLRGEKAAPEAVQWLTQSAEQGYDEAQYRLGLTLYEGKLITRDNVAGARWAYLAADQGHREARRLLKELQLFVDAADLAQARRLADAFKPAKRNLTRED